MCRIAAKHSELSKVSKEVVAAFDFRPAKRYYNSAGPNPSLVAGVGPALFFASRTDNTVFIVSGCFSYKNWIKQLKRLV